MRTFSARETAWLQQLDGIELASFWRRAVAFLLDVFFILIPAMALLAAFTYGYFKHLETQGHRNLQAHLSLNWTRFDIDTNDPAYTRHFDNEYVRIVTEVLVPVLYFGTFTWLSKGRSPGKFITRIRVVSIVHPHLTFWHSVERALGYGAAALEAGFGFLQFFIHPYRRCAQDRLAETIVVTERSFRSRTLAGTTTLPHPD